MSEPQAVQVSSGDIAAVGEHLQALAETLPEGQSAVIRWLLQRAGKAPEEGEVQGYLGSFSLMPAISPAVHAGTSPLFHALGVASLANFGSAHADVPDVSVGVLIN